MKNLKIIFVLLVLIIGACTDLEEQPIGIMVSEGFYESKSDVEAAIFGAYGRMATSASWGGEINQALMLSSDMVDRGQSGCPPQIYEINNFTGTPESWFPTIFWRVGYNVIGCANEALLGNSLIDADESVKLPLEAEARVIRAFHYYLLVRIFGDLPYLDKAITDPGAVSTLHKTPEAEIYQHIIDDLEFGKDHLPMQYSNNVRTRATAGTAATILASVYLTLENWQDAYDNAKWVIDRAGELDYSLVDDYQDLFDATKHDGISEHIFAVDFLGQERYSENDDYLTCLTGTNYTGGWSIDIPSMAVYDNWDPRDYRKKVSFADTIINNGDTIPYTGFFVPRPLIAKYWRYPGNAYGGGRRSDYNYVLFRYAEVLLIAAEALNETMGPNAEVLGYVNQIRERARQWPDKVAVFPPDVSSGLSKEELRDVILEERRIELAFEYKRWFDIKRRELGDEVFIGANSLEPHPDFDKNKHYLLPIPQKEIDMNPNLKPQNPGY